jgi:drug/metabolite transporter (DMT)-like permease
VTGTHWLPAISAIARGANDMKEGLRGSLALILVAVMIAAMGVLVRGLGNQKLDLVQQIAWRVGAAALFGTCLWARRPTLRKLQILPAREWRILALRALLVYGIHLPLLSLSFLHGKFLDVAAAYCFPFPTIFGALLYKETVDTRKALWVAVSLLGLLIISVQALPSWNLGHLYALLAGAAAGLALVMRRSHPEGLTSAATTYAMLVVGAFLVVMPAAVCGEMANVRRLTWRTDVLILLAGALNVACVHLGNYALAGRVNGLRAGSLMTFQIPAAYVLSAASGERLTVPEVIGALLLLVSIWGVNQKESGVGVHKNTQLKEG